MDKRSGIVEREQGPLDQRTGFGLTLQDMKDVQGWWMEQAVASGFQGSSFIHFVFVLFVVVSSFSFFLSS